MATKVELEERVADLEEELEGVYHKLGDLLGIDEEEETQKS